MEQMGPIALPYAIGKAIGPIHTRVVRVRGDKFNEFLKSGEAND